MTLDPNFEDFIKLSRTRNKILVLMRATLNLNTNIQLTVNQLFDLAKQLPQQERIKLASFLVDENEDIMTKSELIGRIRSGLQDVKLHKEGKIKLRTLSEFLADV